MATKKVALADASKMTVADLIAKKKQLISQLIGAKLKNTLGQLENPSQIKWMRRDVARLNTALAVKQK